MNILGLNAFHGDASAALFSNGQLAAAVEEERFNRIKHWAGFPALAAKVCLNGMDPADLAHVAISRNPQAHLWRKLLRVAARPSDWKHLASRAQNSIKVARLAADLTASGVARPDQVSIHHVEHHRAHHDRSGERASPHFVDPHHRSAAELAFLELERGRHP